MLEHPFMDEVNKATYFEMFPHGHQHESHKHLMAQYRHALRRAQRFTLDDDAVRLICHMTKQEKRMELWSILARLPYDTVWIEFDLHEKCKEFERMQTLRHPFKPEEVSKSCGLLFQQDIHSDTRWVCTEFIKVGDKNPNLPCPQPVSLVFDPEGSALNPVMGYAKWKALTLSKHFGEPSVPIMVSDGKAEFTLDQKMDPEHAYLGLMEVTRNVEKDGDFVAMPEELLHKVGAVPEPLWWDWFKNRQEKYYYLALTDAVERVGVLKWYLTALAVINDVPLTTKFVAPRPGKMLTRQGPIKYFSHNLITIKVPKPMDIRFIGRKLNEAAVHAHRAWHRVRGHWRVIEPGKRMAVLCRHDPTMAENGLAICTRCERLIRWIHPHERGTPELGMVEHGYRVQTT